MNSICKIKNKAEKLFGTNAFEHGIFYLYKDSLRFELSIGGTPIEMFHQAFNKGLEVANFAFRNVDDLTACISFYGSKGLLSNLSVFKSLDDLKIKVTKDNSDIWQVELPKEEEFPDDEPMYRTFIALPINQPEFLSLFWSAIAVDMGVRPQIDKASIYLFSEQADLLIHPYDDRGMDVIGGNYALKQKLFKKFNHYLLDYDRDIMNKSFEK